MEEGYTPGNSDKNFLSGLFSNFKLKFSNFGPALMFAAFAGAAVEQISSGGIGSFLGFTKGYDDSKTALANNSVSSNLVSNGYADFANKIKVGLKDSGSPERAELEKFGEEIKKGGFNGSTYFLTKVLKEAGIENGSKTAEEFLASVGDAKKQKGEALAPGDTGFFTNKKNKLQSFTVDEVNGDKVKLSFTVDGKEFLGRQMPPKVKQQIEFNASTQKIDGKEVYVFTPANKKEKDVDVIVQSTDVIDLEKYIEKNAPKYFQAKKEELESKHGSKKVEKEKTPEEPIASSKNKDERSAMTQTVDIRNLGSALTESGAKRNGAGDEVIKKSPLETDYLSLKDIENKKSAKAV